MHARQRLLRHPGSGTGIACRRRALPRHVYRRLLLAHARREQAVDEFIDALRSDVADVQGGTTALGIHLAAMAGTIDVLQRCFAGVDTRDDVLWLNPYWPARLGTLETAMTYRGHVVTLTIADHTVAVSSGPGELAPVRVGCHGQVRELGNGQTLRFTL